MKVAEKGYFNIMVFNREGLVLEDDETFFGTEKGAEEQADWYMENIPNAWTYDIIDRRNRWSMEDLRTYCIRHDYFNAGSNKAYSALLNFVENHEPTEKHVQTVAIWIMTHTAKYEDILDSDDETFDGALDNLQNEIWEECIG